MKLSSAIICLFPMSALLLSCSDEGKGGGVEESLYGKMEDGREVRQFVLRNAAGMEARVIEYGAILVSLTAPDRDGVMADVTLGHDDLEGWVGDSAYFGATVGRYGNRIAEGRFRLDGVDYELAKNNEPGGIPCHLHGGIQGFHRVLWDGVAFEEEGVRGVRLRYVSADGEEGYPGELEVEVSYTLTDANELLWDARASTDQATIINLVHHSYWNLGGDPSQSINDHELTIDASHYLPTNAGLIPTGELAPVEGTPMDFRESRVIGSRLGEDFEALELGGGYDHAWVLDEVPEGGLVRAARLLEVGSGRVMEVFTNQPAVQFYGGNFLDGSVVGKGGVRYERRSGLCLETENFPDAPNQAGFPSAVLRPGELYHHRMVHRFSTE